MAGYTKLFASIVHSTVWREPDHVRIVWITMLAISDRDGHVEASVPGLADAARVTLDQCIAALTRLSEPDPWSRNREHEGRRIATIEGGWLILNHNYYRDRMAADVKRQQTAERVRRHRERACNVDVTGNALQHQHQHQPPAPTTTTTTTTTTSASARAKKTPDGLQRVLDHFARGWAERYSAPWAPPVHARKLVASLLHARPRGVPGPLHVPALLTALDRFFAEGGDALLVAQHPLGWFAKRVDAYFPATRDDIDAAYLPAPPAHEDASGAAKSPGNDPHAEAGS